MGLDLGDERLGALAPRDHQRLLDRREAGAFEGGLDDRPAQGDDTAGLLLSLHQ